MKRLIQFVSGLGGGGGAGGGSGGDNGKLTLYWQE